MPYCPFKGSLLVHKASELLMLTTYLIIGTLIMYWFELAAYTVHHRASQCSQHKNLRMVR